MKNVLIALFTSIGLVAAFPAYAEETTLHGFERDERGRHFQTSFDLRKRGYVGIHYGLHARGAAVEWPGALSLSGAGVFDTLGDLSHYTGFDDVEERPGRHVRRRLRVLDTTLNLAPLTLDTTVVSWDRSVEQLEPQIWVSTFIGPPRRFDVPLSIGYGYSLGQLRYLGPDSDNFLMLDFLQPRINWELFQGRRLENYLVIRTGAGPGLHYRDGFSNTPIYLSLDAGIDGRWRLGNTGLAELSVRVGTKWGHWLPTLKDDNGEGSFLVHEAAVSVERIIVAINDQPVSLYLEPSARMVSGNIQYPRADLPEVRVLAGARFNFLSPPRAPETR